MRSDNLGSLWSFCHGRAGSDATRRLLTLLYEDVDLTRQFLDLVRQKRQHIESGDI